MPTNAPPTAPARVGRSFLDIGDKYQGAITDGRISDSRRYWNTLMQELDRFRTDVYSKISDQSTTNNTVPIGNGTLGGLPNGSNNPNGPNTTTTGSGVYKVFEATVVAGQGIIPASAIFVNGLGAAYLATATNNARYCNGICIGGAGAPNKILYICGGFVNALHVIPRVTNSGELYLSVTPGKFTDDPNESPETKKFSQYCGLFHKFVTNSLNPTGICEISFTYSPPMSFTGP